MSEENRREFEEWALSAGYWLHINPCDDIEKYYDSSDTESAWEAWQAAREQLTEQRDEEREIYQKSYSAELARSNHYKQQRDRLEIIAGQLIAMIRMNVIGRTFEECTIGQIDKHLKPWIDEIAAVKGGSDE